MWTFKFSVFELLIIPIFLFHSSCLADRDLKQSNGIFSYKLYQVSKYLDRSFNATTQGDGIKHLLLFVFPHNFFSILLVFL